MKPADYTLDETCLIIEKGLGKNAASLFRENAIRAKSIEIRSESSRIDRLENMVEKLVLAIATIPQQIAQNQSSQPIQDYYSIMGYANKKGMQIMFSDALRLGKEAAKLSNEKGIEIRKVPDERFGNVNSYHVDILVKVFEV
ncbi:MAG: hypothetical protein AMQ22_02279 [Candidatus Methanofastidiosum methylothiophilum]|uniref:Uncharacterized protein n=1 Tax=Candidatus Methanofastidiosum methylothiophilum TaxID=1705564 RepID=A0A150II90_9EURY|nr:MAG: hypothetical protein AMQ22_02279 [Candidatus Methanofastidiosum methylthiophilus]